MEGARVGRRWARPRAEPQAARPALPRSPAGSAPEHLLRLQCSAGNHAVARLLAQRQVVTPVLIGGTLTAGQRATARAFYHSNPKQYTPAIINQIRDKLGLADGGVDDALLDAVFAFQDDHNLKTDGMAGVRTLAVLFPSGLARGDAEQTFTTDEKAALTGWESRTPTERLDALAAPAKTQLTAADVGVLPEYVPFPFDDVNAIFEAETWKVHVRTSLLERPTLTEDQEREVGEMIYHESRHVEQHHKMARMRAARGLSADAIAKEMKLPQPVAEDAFAHPLSPGTPEFIVAEERYKSRYGSGKADTEATEADVRVKKVRLEQAAKYAKEHPDDPVAQQRFLAARVAFERAEDRYKYLPLEADAYHVQDDVDLLWTAP